MYRTSGAILLFSDGIPTSGISAKEKFAFSGNLKHLVNHDITISAIQFDITESYFASYGSPYDTKRRHFGRYGSLYDIKRRYFGRYGSLYDTKERYFVSYGSLYDIKERYFASVGSLYDMKRRYFVTFGLVYDIKRHFLLFNPQENFYHFSFSANCTTLIKNTNHILSGINKKSKIY